MSSHLTQSVNVFKTICYILFNNKLFRDCAPYAANVVCTSQLSLIIDIVGLSIQSNLYYTHFKKSVVTALPKLAIPQFYIISYFRIITLHLTLLVNIGRADNVCLVRWAVISREAWIYIWWIVIIFLITNFSVTARLTRQTTSASLGELPSHA